MIEQQNNSKDLKVPTQMFRNLLYHSRYGCYDCSNLFPCVLAYKLFCIYLPNIEIFERLFIILA